MELSETIREALETQVLEHEPTQAALVVRRGVETAGVSDMAGIVPFQGRGGGGWRVASSDTRSLDQVYPANPTRQERIQQSGPFNRSGDLAAHPTSEDDAAASLDIAGRVYPVTMICPVMLGCSEQM